MKTLLTLVAIVISISGFTQNFNKIMGKAVKKALNGQNGGDLKGYKVFSYPTDNYGLVTSYNNSAADENFICDMWNCIGFADADIPVTTSDWMKMNGFAAVGTGGAISLSSSKKNKVAAKVVLPKIYNVIGVSGGFDKDKATNVTINIGKAYLRKLRRDPVISLINNLPNDRTLKVAYQNNRLVLAIADCVIEDLSVDVNVDSGTKADLDAKLAGAASKVFNDGSLSVAVERNVSGTYTFRVKHPVIFAVLYARQPSQAGLEATEFFEGWTPIDLAVDKSIFDKLE